MTASAPSHNGRKRPGIEEQRRHILSAAVDLFSVHGSKVVSVSDICKSAEVSRDTYYRCFTDKESLVSQLYQTSVNDHIEAVLSAWDSIKQLTPFWNSTKLRNYCLLNPQIQTLPPTMSFIARMKKQPNACSAGVKKSMAAHLQVSI